jgi:hydroxymethylglutaryl-CoA reductase (NADPH)
MGTNSKLHEMNEQERQEFIESKLNISINNIKKSILNENDVKANIENLIGSVQVPLGIAGPVKINGEHAKNSFYLPLATSEGALVASVARGCKVINESNGANVVIIKNEQSRSILFKTNSIKITKELGIWVKKNFDKLKKIGELDEPFIEIKNIEIYEVGLNVWLRIKAYTNDAMGMNMITISGKKIADYIIQNYNDIEFISETGNMCSDKKPSAINLINSRGKKVIASVNVTNDTIKKILKTTSEQLIDMNYRKNLLGSAASGSMGFNAHFANIIAAMFIATGQDAAHVVDGSIGFTTVEKNKEGVNFSVTIPALQVGTIGGGTSLPTQLECLKILGCHGPSKNGLNSKKLAEIIATAVLAGEISLLGALCSKELSKSHVEHNR